MSIKAALTNLEEGNTEISAEESAARPLIPDDLNVGLNDLTRPARLVL
jgi:hypothetical protein